MDIEGYLSNKESDWGRRQVCHVVGSSRLVFGGVENNTAAYKVLLKPLLWVCSNFRAVALSLFCNCFELGLTDTALSEQEDQYLPLDHPDLGYPTFHLAKELDIEICEDGVYTGKVLDMLSHSPYNGCVFPWFSSESDMAQSLQLARQNASTLQSLILESNHDIDVCRLVKGTAGCYATYPLLRILKIFEHLSDSEQHRPVLDGVVPFPGLRHLVIERPYPFDNDTLFRGNAATLECLDMVLDSPTISMLCQYKVFTATSHPELQCVNFTQDDIRLPHPFTTAAGFMQFMLSIAPKTSVREIGGFFGCTELASTLPLLENHVSIQVLTLVNISLEFWDIIALIKSLPLLSDLHSSFPPPSFEALTADTNPAELPVHICASHAPMGKRFRCWHLKYYDSTPHRYY
ncbi:hypothetical protein GGH93_001844 [Coemansia aciculifera]|nr:hypothetical protein GGH93_001844 [Coemansia aciculifera]